MGMSEVATTLILFSASVAVAGGVVALLGVTVQDMVHASEQRGDELSERLRTGVRIVNDPADLPTTPVRVYVKNTGVARLDPNATTLLVDGVVRDAATLTVLDAANPGWWSPGEVLEASDVTLVLAAGDHSLTVVVERGVKDSLRVRV